MSELSHKLEQLQLTGMCQELDHVLADSAARNFSHAETVEWLTDIELEARRERCIERRFRLSKLQAKVGIESFNFNHHKSRTQLKNKILRLLDLDFITQGTNLVLIGNPGTGKTFLGKILGWKACQANIRVLFTTAMNMLNQLVASQVDHSLVRKLKAYTKTAAGGSLAKNPYTVEESKALAAFLGCDCIWYLQRAPVFAQQRVGQEGRGFMGEGMIKSEADLEKIKLPDPTRDELYREAEHFAKNKGDYALVFVTRIGFFQTVLSMGTENFLVSLYTDRPLVEKILDIYFDWMTVVVERMCQIGYDIFWTTDDYAYKTGMFFSPSTFREVIAPRYRRALNKCTIPWFLQSDGNIMESMDTLVELGVAACSRNTPAPILNQRTIPLLCSGSENHMRDCWKWSISGALPIKNLRHT